MDVLIDTLHRKTACLRKQLGVLSKYKVRCLCAPQLAILLPTWGVHATLL